MHKKNLSSAFHVGGSVKTALNGDYHLDTSTIIQEAVKLTQKHFWYFLPAIVFFIATNIILFLLILTLVTGDPFVVLKSFISAKDNSQEIDNAVRVSMFFSSVLSAPLYAGASLMGLSHAIGFRTKPSHIIKGLSYSMLAIMAMFLVDTVKNVSNEFIPLLGLFLGIAFSMTILLICEKNLSILQAMQISFRATMRKMLPITCIYIILAGMLIFSYATAGIALIWVLPFMFNVKGVLYREMFGVGIEVELTKNEKSNEIFHA